MAKKGGFRAGAGRPKGAKSPNTRSGEVLRAYIIDHVSAKVDELIEAKMALALGHKKIHVTQDGTEVVYVQSPDGNAIQYLLNQAIGKPRETVDVQTEIHVLKIE